MFDILSVSLVNFRSYREQKFTFPSDPGLYSLTGENLANSRLGSNGAGKSSLLEAIHWCLYGKTSRGLKANDIVTWGEKTCKVTVTLKINNAVIQVKRGQNPNALTVGGRQVDQESLEKALRLTQPQFTYAVMFPQFADSFFDLAPAAKLALFSEIMGLEFWLEKSRTADALAKELAEVQAQHEQLIARYEGQIHSARIDVKELKLKSAEFKGERNLAVKELKSKLLEHTNTAQHLQKTLVDVERIVAGLQKRLDNQGDHGSSEVLYDRFNRLEAELKNLATLGPTCSACLQPINKRHLVEQSMRLKGEIKQTKQELRVAADAERDLQVIQKNLLEHEREAAQAEYKLSLSRNRSKELRRAIEAEEARGNPYQAMLEDKVSVIGTLSVKSVAERKELEQTMADHAAVSYWISGFKRVRLFIIESALQQLEVEVNNSLASLGLTDWRIEFDVERENKAGGVTKGFVVLIHAPGQGGPVRWEAWSGGETQRLRLAGNLGLANLIMEKAGLVSQIEFYDEFSAHMGTGGVEDTLETLHARAHSSGRKVWCVDHNSLEFGGFAGVLCAIKDDEGTRLESS